MSAQYDNTNTVSVFQSAPQGTIIGSGSIFFGDNRRRMILVDDVTPNGKPIMRVFVEAGAVWDIPADKQRDKGPVMSGKLEVPATDCNQIALWARTSKNNGSVFWSGRIEKFQPNSNAKATPSSAAPQSDDPLDDDIPF